MDTQANPLLSLRAHGQCVWQDDLRRQWLEDGTLKRLTARDGVSGITSNPTTFHAAIEGHDEYDERIARLAAEGRSPAAILEALTVADVGDAADLLRPRFDESGGADGYVSIEVSPHLAYDTERSVVEARRLWIELSRPNVLIKVPATREGIEAMRRLTAEGINVNATLLFSVSRYREIADAYMAGLEDRLRSSQGVEGITSVASFFLSRVDALADRMLEHVEQTDLGRADQARALRGHAAVALARLAYQAYRELVDSARWRKLAGRGARPQRLLWASTGTKDPAYSDVKYVEALIGPDTIATLKPETLDAYRDHGDPAPRLTQDLQQAQALPGKLAELHIDLEALARELEKEGVRKFIEPYDATLALLERR
ncbi:MAG TPA: transaldolase [Pelomicrobium sp.]|nr:transaldolase [Pelomicrobium sp.]